MISKIAQVCRQHCVAQRCEESSEFMVDYNCQLVECLFHVHKTDWRHSLVLLQNFVVAMN